MIGYVHIFRRLKEDRTERTFHADIIKINSKDYKIRDEGIVLEFQHRNSKFSDSAFDIV